VLKRSVLKGAKRRAYISGGSPGEKGATRE
jgi:hypothetical protein